MGLHASQLIDGDPEDIIRLANPTAEDITVKWAGVPHELKAGETQMFTRYIGEHICKHLTDREIIRLGKKGDLNSKKQRQDWRSQIIVGIVNKAKKPQRNLTPGEQAAKEQEAMRLEQDKRISTLEEQLKRATRSSQVDPAAVREAIGDTTTSSSPPPPPTAEQDAMAHIDIAVEEPDQPLTWPAFSKQKSAEGVSREEASAQWKAYKKEHGIGPKTR